jgi:putative transposase
LIRPLPCLAPHGLPPGGVVCHVLNRANARATIFEDDNDFMAFERVMAQAIGVVRMRILAYLIMPNHWHLVLWPRRDGGLGRFMQRLTTTHVRRWYLNRHSIGDGHLYQGTYKSFPVQNDAHLLTVLRYVERNTLRANLVARAEAWRWSSLWLRLNPKVETEAPPLSPWPVERPGNWGWRVNQPETDEELNALRESARRGRPFSSERWQKRIGKRLGLESTFRPRGRPTRTQTTSS